MRDLSPRIHTAEGEMDLGERRERGVKMEERAGNTVTHLSHRFRDSESDQEAYAQMQVNR
jgi:hypothetical protein